MLNQIWIKHEDNRQGAFLAPCCLTKRPVSSTMVFGTTIRARGGICTALWLQVGCIMIKTTKSICIYFTIFIVTICGLFLYFKINLDAYEEEKNIVLKFSSLSKVKNIYQMENNHDHIETPDIIITVYDKKMLKILDIEDQSVSEYNQNMIINVQYARSGMFFLSKENIVNLVGFRVQNGEPGYIKFYWTVSDSYFPIICKWKDNTIKECVETQ